MAKRRSRRGWRAAGAASLISGGLAAATCAAAAALSEPPSGGPERACGQVTRGQSTPFFLTPGAHFAGPATQVRSGQVLCVALGPTPGQWVEVRLTDAPSGADEASRRALAGLVDGQAVSCRAEGREGEQILARCHVGGQSLGERLRQPTRPAGR